MDKYGYPTTEELEQIKNFNGNLYLFLDLVKGCWNYAENGGFKIYQKQEDKFLVLQLHTFGWSGNEKVIATLQETMFWFFFWQQSIRGGHYWFEVNLSLLGGFTEFGVSQGQNKKRLHLVKEPSHA